MNRAASLFLATAMLIAPLTFARHFVVATTGSDNGDGSAASPWQTFDHALAALGAGDTLFVRGGVYHESMSITMSGDAITGDIVIESWPGEIGELNNNDSTGTGIAITGAYVTLRNLIVGHWSNGIDIMAPAHHITLLQCTVYDIGFGIALYDGVHDVSLSKCDIYHFGWFGFDATAGGATNLIYNVRLDSCLSHDADYTIPIHNGDMNADGFAFGHDNERDITLTNCRAERTGDGFDLDGHNIHVINCTASYTHYGAGGGFKCWGDSVWLINCLSYKHLNSGIELDQETDSAEQFHNKPTHTYIINCTDADNGLAGIQVYDTLKKLFMWNTILAGGNRTTGADTGSMKGLEFDMTNAAGVPVNYVGDYNIFHSINSWRFIDCPDVAYGVDASQSSPLAAWQTLTQQDLHSYFADPRFFGGGGFLLDDYRLDATSQAINAGTADHSWPTDMNSNARDSHPDIGCYEGGLTSIQTHSIATSPNQLLFPNPAHDVVKISAGGSRTGVVKILDLTGRVLREQDYSVGKDGETIEVSLQGLVKGTYLCARNNGKTGAMTVVTKE